MLVAISKVCLILPNSYKTQLRLHTDFGYEREDSVDLYQVEHPEALAPRKEALAVSDLVGKVQTHKA